jgi:hypothetical protein
MDHRKLSIYSILIIAAIILSGCATTTPEVTTAATAEAPQECPTSVPQECPAEAVEPQAMNQWRWGYTKDLANVIITFDPGDKCSLELIKPTEDNGLAFDLVVNDQTYENYAVAIVSLEEGKGINDLEAYHKEGGASYQNPPPWSNLEEIEIVQPMSRTFHAVHVLTSPLYFVCLVQGPENQRVIEEFDGIDISGY